MKRMSSWALVALLAVPTFQEDPVKAIRSSDPLVRLEAVRQLSAAKDPKSAKLLIDALDDDDWEVAESAAGGLGILRSEKALDPLIKVALRHSIGRVRHAAADALAQIDGVEAYGRLVKKARRESIPRAVRRGPRSFARARRQPSSAPDYGADRRSTDRAPE